MDHPVRIVYIIKEIPSGIYHFQQWLIFVSERKDNAISKNRITFEVFFHNHFTKSLLEIMQIYTTENVTSILWSIKNARNYS